MRAMTPPDASSPRADCALLNHRHTSLHLRHDIQAGEHQVSDLGAEPHRSERGYHSTDIGGFVHDVEAAKKHQQAHHHFGRIQHAFEPQLREAKIQ